MTSASDRQGKLLDRQLRGVAWKQDASFEEKDMSLFALEKDLIGQILTRDAIRQTSGEQTCRLPHGIGDTSIGDFQFIRHPVSSFLIHESEHLRITIMPDTFRSDAEEVMQGISEQRNLLERIAPAQITIGLVPDSLSSLAKCVPSLGEVAFFANRSGGLLLSGMAHFTKDDEFPVSCRQVAAHEFTHALERNEHVQEKIKPLTEALIGYAKEGFPDSGETAQCLSHYCTVISPGYLPGRMREWRNSENPTSELEASNMASEFWAELCTAAQLGNAKPFSRVDTQLPPLESLREFISSDYKSLLAGALKNGVRNGKHRDVVNSLPGPSYSDIHDESIGSRIAYKLETQGRSGR